MTAPGLVGVVSSSPPGTAQGPSPGTVASIVRAAGLDSAPATLRTAHTAQVSGVKDGSPGKGWWTGRVVSGQIISAAGEISLSF